MGFRDHTISRATVAAVIILRCTSGVYQTKLNQPLGHWCLTPLAVGFCSFFLLDTRSVFGPHASRFETASAGESTVTFSMGRFERSASILSSWVSILSSRLSTVPNRSSVETTASAAPSTTLTRVCFLV